MARTAVDHAAAGAVINPVQNRERRLAPGSGPVAVAPTDADVSSDREIAVGVADAGDAIGAPPAVRWGNSGAAVSTRRMGFSRPSFVEALAGAEGRPSSLSFPTISR